MIDRIHFKKAKESIYENKGNPVLGIEIGTCSESERKFLNNGIPKIAWIDSDGGIVIINETALYKYEEELSNSNSKKYQIPGFLDVYGMPDRMTFYEVTKHGAWFDPGGIQTVLTFENCTTEQIAFLENTKNKVAWQDKTGKYIVINYDNFGKYEDEYTKSGSRLYGYLEWKNEEPEKMVFLDGEFIYGYSEQRNFGICLTAHTREQLDFMKYGGPKVAWKTPAGHFIVVNEDCLDKYKNEWGNKTLYRNVFARKSEGLKKSCLALY